MFQTYFIPMQLILHRKMDLYSVTYYIPLCVITSYFGMSGHFYERVRAHNELKLRAFL